MRPVPYRSLPLFPTKFLTFRLCFVDCSHVPYLSLKRVRAHARREVLSPVGNVGNVGNTPQKQEKKSDFSAFFRCFWQIFGHFVWALRGHIEVNVSGESRVSVDSKADTRRPNPPMGVKNPQRARLLTVAGSRKVKPRLILPILALAYSAQIAGSARRAKEEGIC